MVGSPVIVGTSTFATQPANSCRLSNFFGTLLVFIVVMRSHTLTGALRFKPWCAHCASCAIVCKHIATQARAWWLCHVCNVPVPIRNKAPTFRQGLCRVCSMCCVVIAVLLGTLHRNYQSWQCPCVVLQSFHHQLL